MFLYISDDKDDGENDDNNNTFIIIVLEYIDMSIARTPDDIKRNKPLLFAHGIVDINTSKCVSESIGKAFKYAQITFILTLYNFGKVGTCFYGKKQTKYSKYQKKKENIKYKHVPEMLSLTKIIL